ncbi:MAG: hypothetical protein ACNA7W_10660 [Pseudomonadales bacterium]
MVIRTLALATALASVTAVALEPGSRVDNFSLLDHRGTAHELYYLSDKNAVVILAQGGDCASDEATLASLASSRDAFAGQGVEFLVLDSSRAGGAADDRFAASDAQGFAVLLDETQIIGESLGLNRAGEVLVIEPQGWSLSYRGSAGEPLQRALGAVLDGAGVEQTRTEVGGCAMAFPERERRAAHAQISYSDVIAPMLIDACVTCHRPGGIGPWAMSEYNMVRGFAPMIREVVRTRRMPPWHADPRHGSFSNDRSLTAEQARTLVHWIEAGAPRGDGADPLATFEHDWPEWSLGKPDLIVDLPAFDVPATGVVEYMYPTVKNPLDHDVWVRAAEIIPGSREALHHVITSFGVPDPAARRGLSREGSLGGYVPGADADVFPAGTGVLLPADAVFRLQMHYTTFGRAVTDRSRMGLYFHDTPPEHELQTTILMNPRLRIPPHAKAHSEFAETELARDILVYNLLPHAHYRGRASQFKVVYPDGAQELLLSVPNYDFNWQTTYELSEPKRLPAGTRIVHTTTWDNSAQNPANPDPTREVPWGEQSWDEMLFGAIRWRYLTDTESAPGAELAQQPGERR